MDLETALFTVLPHGLFQGQHDILRASIFVAPRLSTGGAGERPLSDYDLFGAWPDIVADLDLQLEFDGVAVVPAKADPDAPGPDRGIFDTVFSDEIAVRDHSFTDLSSRTWHSYPAAQLAHTVLDSYRAVGLASPEALPPVTTGPLSALVAEIGRVGAEPASDDKLLDRLRDAEHSQLDLDRSRRYVPPSAYTSSAQRFTAANRFYDRYRGVTRLRDEMGTAGTPVPPPPTAPRIDLHAYLGALGDYPELLRRLGLVLDVIVERPSPLKEQGRVRLVVANPVADFMGHEGTRPWTNYVLRDPLFVARPRHERYLRDGQLDFHTERLFVEQVDIDGSALKLIHASASMDSTRRYLASDAPTGTMTADEGSLPALRSNGFTVVHRDRVESVVEQTDRAVLAQAAVAADVPPDLFAEDVTRGYRLDVDRDGFGFRTLCAREGSYAVRRADGSQVPIPLPPDEGYVKGASTTSVPGDPDVYLHEAMASWGGWSLVAGRPGHTVTTEETLDTSDPVPEASPDVPLLTSFRAQPGTLTPLRFGSTYRLRGRTVDLAGNSVDDKDLDDQAPSDPQTFRRWEPVPHPLVLPHRGYGEGESQLRLVVRSTLGATPQEWSALPRVSGLAAHSSPDTAYLADDSRWLAPPKTSQQMAELHGGFDAAFGPAASAAAVDAGYDLAARESGELPDQPDRSPLTTPYLPDRCSRGASLRTLPGAAPGSARVQAWPSEDDGGPWHDRQPFRLEIVEGSAAPQWVGDERVLRVFLPQAELTRVQLSSGVAARDLAVHGIWDLVGSASLETRAREGRLWMITPGVELVLVHAVEKPLTAPVVGVPQSGMERRSGESFVSLVGTIDNHAKSTGRLDVEAAWSMQLDDLSETTPADGVDGRTLRSTFGHVGDFDIVATEDQARTGRTDATGHGMPPRHLLRHDLGDTRHRVVGYHAKATTRFREYFDPHIWEQREADGTRVIEHVGAVATRHVPSSRRPDPPDVAYIVPTFTWTESVESMPARALGVSAAVRRGGSAGVGVGVGGRAAVGRRLMKTVVRTRTCGLRVWLDRPWYSSGDGELLGVVVRKQPWLTWPVDLAAGFEVSALARETADRVAITIADRGLVPLRGRATLSPSERLMAVPSATAELNAIGPTLGTLFPAVTVGAPERLLTTWGADPAFRSADPAGGPYIHQFPLRTAVGHAVVPEEETRSEVTVIGHTPQFDADRGMWFCDLEIDAGSSYTPFIRLGLARYQPWSIDGHHLSRVVVPDFVQLMPRRAARVSRSLPRIHVSVRGPVGLSSLALVPAEVSVDDLRRTRRVTATVQTRPAGATDDLLWRAVGEPLVLDPDVSGGVTSVLWSGWLAKEAVPDGQERRILVQEFELHESDADGVDPFDAVEEQRLDILFASVTRHVRSRLVYADALPY